MAMINELFVCIKRRHNDFTVEANRETCIRANTTEWNKETNQKKNI